MAARIVISMRMRAVVGAALALACSAAPLRVARRSAASPLRVARGGYAAPAAVCAVADAYAGALASCPTATNAATAAALASCSDGIAQAATPGERWDRERTAWMALWGTAISGVVLQYWFVLLQRLFPDAATSNAHLAGKLFVNQLVMSPGLNGAFFAFVILTREAPRCRWSPDKSRAYGRKVAADLPRTIARSCAFWICVQTLNFRFLPARWTTVVSNVAFLVWNSYLSLVGNRGVRA